jgi:hypothetical protein
VITLLLIYVVELLVLISPFYAKRDHALTKEVREVENSRDGHQELAAKEKCISEERMKNCYLQRKPTPSSKNNSKSRRGRTKVSPFLLSSTFP